MFLDDRTDQDLLDPNPSSLHLQDQEHRKGEGRRYSRGNGSQPRYDSRFEVDGVELGSIGGRGGGRGGKVRGVEGDGREWGDLFPIHGRSSYKVGADDTPTLLQGHREAYRVEGYREDAGYEGCIGDKILEGQGSRSIGTDETFDTVIGSLRGTRKDLEEYRAIEWERGRERERRREKERELAAMRAEYDRRMRFKSRGDQRGLASNHKMVASIDRSPIDRSSLQRY